MGFFSFGKADPLAKLRGEIEARPRDPRLAMTLAAQLKALGHQDAAAEEFLRAAALFKAEGFLPRAVAAAAQAAQLTPRAPQTWLALANLHAAQKHKEDEREALKKLIDAHRANGESDDAAQVRARLEALGPGR